MDNSNDRYAVYKYRLEPETILALPAGSEILCVDSQFDEIFVWVKQVVYSDMIIRFVDREFHVYGTGKTIEDHEKMKYIGTVQIHSGRFIFHVFEKVENDD